MEDKTNRQRVERNITFQLTLGERLLIWRRRKNWTQGKAAKHHKLSIFLYKMAEYDKAKNLKLQDVPTFESLLAFERCLIYRRRSGKKQREIALELKVGKYWLGLQETGKISCDKLLKYWEG